MALRVFCGLLGVACAGLAFGAVAAILSGGYEPQRYAGAVDPVRTGMLVFFAAGTAAFALIGVAGLVARRDGSDVALTSVALVGGLAISMASLLVLVAWYPASSGPFVVPVPVRIGMLLGVGVMVLSYFRRVSN